MSLPVRLMFGDNRFTIPVQAEEITMAVHRKLHAFPIPFDGSQRIGIDTNMAAMQMNLSLILQDDTGVLPNDEGQPLVNVLNFAKYKTGVNSLSFANKLLFIPVAIFGTNTVYGTAADYTQSQIKLVMDGTTTSNLAGGSGTPSVRSGHTLLENGQVIIDVPVGGIDSAPDNGDSAATIALAVKAALELTTQITNLNTGVDNVGGKRVTDAFTVTISGQNSAVLLVEQKYVDPTREFSYTVDKAPDIIKEITASLGPGQGTVTFPQVTLGGTLLTQTACLQPNLPSLGVSGRTMSAGDKAQTLMGLLANAKNSQDLLRGIQIPYDSLIQSDAVTPEVRNFFTTYGRNTSPSRKSSEANTSPASKPMLSPSVSSKDGRSVLDEASESNGFNFEETLIGAGDAILDFAFDDILNLGSLYDGFKDIATGVGDALRGEVSSQSKANGIYVLPEKFHLRKEAAKNYYVADLDLIMVHKVAGV